MPLRRLLRPDAFRQGLGRDHAVIFLCQRLHLRGRDVAGNHQHGVVGRIPAAIERHRVLARQPAHLVFPADDRDAVGVVEEQRRLRLLPHDRARIVLGAGAALFENHQPFAVDLLLRDRQVGHPVGLDLHHHFQAVAGHALVIAGIVARGQRVLLAAIGGDDLGEHAGGQGVGTLEHQMLEEMRDARFARRLIGRAGLVPHHVQHDRRAPVGDHDHLQAVGQGEGFGIVDTLAGLDLRRFGESGAGGNCERARDGGGEQGGGANAAQGRSARAEG